MSGKCALCDAVASVEYPIILNPPIKLMDDNTRIYCDEWGNWQIEGQELRFGALRVCTEHAGDEYAEQRTMHAEVKVKEAW